MRIRVAVGVFVGANLAAFERIREFQVLACGIDDQIWMVSWDLDVFCIIGRRLRAQLHPYAI